MKKSSMIINKSFFSHFQLPSTPEEWTAISDEFGNLHQFWNTLGAIDGKHVAIIKPPQSGSTYYNYKGFFSIVLLAVVNAQKEFICIDVGINGKISDGGVLYYSDFGRLMQEGKLNLPGPSALPNTNELFPHVFVGDEAFALTKEIMKPFSEKTLNPERLEFNRRLSRARVVVENTFGILVSRFGVFQKPIHLIPEKAIFITMACCYLHNFLARESRQSYFSTSTITSVERSDLVNLESTHRRNSSRDAKSMREKFCAYYNNEGKM